ncbi:MAG: hypothetical protein F4029_06800 [Gammaproteobacteria bacterium]|nr:hypothetical protein [Gammaproteobacteria bacterium]MXY57685.1 hypothetical protein [Gammaproteobacteria bacterium]MYF29640.1 hypothetical protein [Gammaproteobacteria bacterium]MYK45919.1 hypothetical protein [Gammaproteobacteria bacterium]
MAKRRFTQPDLADAVEGRVGPYRLAMVYRHVTGDQGPTIHVFGPVEGQHREILRFDCFDNVPHVHLGISYLDEPVQMIDSAKPFEWALDEIVERLPDYLARSRAGPDLPDDWRLAAGRAAKAFRRASARA